MSAEELAALEDWLHSAAFKGAHLEIGTAAGGTLCFMMKLYPDESRPRFSVVDTMAYFQDQREIVNRNLTENGLDPAAVDFRIQTSAAAFEAAERAGDRFDFILIDASHKIRHVMQDLRWLRLLNAGGIACFHDYKPAFRGVMKPIDRLLRRHPNYSRLGPAGSLLGIRKDSESARAEVNAADRLWSLLYSPLLQWELSLRKRLNRAPKPDSNTP